MSSPEKEDRNDQQVDEDNLNQNSEQTEIEQEQAQPVSDSNSNSSDTNSSEPLIVVTDVPTSSKEEETSDLNSSKEKEEQIKEEKEKDPEVEVKPDKEEENEKEIDSKKIQLLESVPILAPTEDDEEDSENPILKEQDFTNSPVKENLITEEEMWPFFGNSSPSSKAEFVESSFEAFDSSTHGDTAMSAAELAMPEFHEDSYELDPNVSRNFDTINLQALNTDTRPSAPPVEIMNGNYMSPTNSQNRTTTPRNNTDELMKHISHRAEILHGNDENISPALKRRLRDFDFAQKKRRETYGERQPWGIIGLYDHLSGIRTDIEWAEDAAWRRANHVPYLSWADFEAAKATGFNQPFFTYIVIAVCTACLIWSIQANGWKVESISLNPMIGPSAQTLIYVGAKQTSLIVNDNQWWRLVTPIFLHAGVIHFVLNMLALWFIGYAVEMNHGFVAVMILFIVPAVGGTLLSALFLPEYISVGASGGIFGLIGGCIADIMSNWKLLFSKEVNTLNDGKRFRHAKVLVWLIIDILLNVLIGLTPFVDNFTHLGGMVYGILCGLSKLERLSKAFFGVQKGFCSKLQNSLIRLLGIITSLVCIIITLIVLINSDGDRTPCKGCRFVSCVPFPFWVEYENKWWYCDDCDMVQADARQNTASGIYTSMNLTCPDGDISYVDLLDEGISDAGFLQKQLPRFCRNECDSLFAT